MNSKAMRTTGTRPAARPSPNRLWFAAALLLAAGRAAPGLAETPAVPDPRQHNCPWLDDVIDDQELPTRSENREEYYAYNYLVTFARRFTPEQMGQAARKELTWHLLQGKERSKYRGEVVRVEGRLKRLAWIGSNRSLEAEGVKDLYEAWVYPFRNNNENPICVILSELPPGLEPNNDYAYSVPVVADGYFFKRYKYRAKDGVRLAPLVIGRTLTVKEIAPSPAEADTGAFISLFLPVLFTLLFGVIVAAVVLHRWFRRGDRRALASLARTRPTEFVLPDLTTTARRHDEHS